MTTEVVTPNTTAAPANVTSTGVTPVVTTMAATANVTSTGVTPVTVAGISLI